MPDAIYIACEYLAKEPAKPALLGVLRNVAGEQHLRQFIVHDELKPIAAASRRTTAATLRDAIQSMADDAENCDCAIVAWNRHDLDAICRASGAGTLGRRIRARSISAVAIARHWRTKLHPDLHIERTGTLNPNDSFRRYAQLAHYPHLTRLLRASDAAEKIRRVHAALGRAARYRDLTPDVRDDWRAVLDGNAHVLRALREIWTRASDELAKWREYERATYCVDSDRGGTIAFKAGSTSTRLDALLERHDANRWAFMTAWNPGSVPLRKRDNSRRQAAMNADLAKRGFRTLTGRGVGDDASWEPEESLLVLDVETQEARRIARRFGQFAIVAGRKGRPARLVSCA